MPHALFSSRISKSHSASRRSLRRAAGLGLGFLSLLSVSAAHAGTVNWDKTPGDWFANPTHWDNGSYPGAGDDAVNMSTAAMTLGQSTTVNRFFSNGAFSLQGGTFSGSQASSLSTITVNNVFTVNEGGISNFTVNQGTGGSFVLGSSGGNFLDNTIIGSSVDMATNPSAFLRLYDTNTFNGAITLGSTSELDLRDGNANMVIGTAGSLAGAGTVTQDFSGATLTNNGTINANSTGNTLNITNSTLNSAAGSVLEASNGGILSLSSTITSAASILASGGTVDISGTFTGTGGTITASNGGMVNILGTTLLGTINTDANTALILNSSGTNNLSGTTVNGNLDLATDNGAYLRAFGVDTVNGAITLGPTGILDLRDGNTNLTLGSGGSLAGSGTVTQDFSGSTLTNNGTINANVGGQTLNQINSNFVNNGTAEATNGGILSLSNNVTNNGALNATGTGSLVTLAGTFTGGGSNLITASGGGQVQVNGVNLLGTINEATGTALVFNGSGTNNLNGTTINGNLDLATNNGAFLRFFNTDTVNGVISLGTTSNGLDLRDGNANLILNGGLTGYGSVSEDFGGSTLTNNGTVNANVGGQTLSQINSNFVNNGTAEATNGGILSLSNNVTNNGLLAASSGGILDISGTFTSSLGNSINGVGGTVNINGVNLVGTINETAGTSLVLNSSGANNLNGTTINGNLDLATNTNAFLRAFNADTVNGAITLGPTGTLDLRDGNTNLTLGGSGLVGSGTVTQDFSGATLTNNGGVVANVAGQQLNLQVSTFNNNYIVQATNGATLNLDNTNTNANDGSTLASNNAGSVVSITGTYTGAGNDFITTAGGGQVQVNGATLLGTINTDANTALVFNGSGANNLSGTTVNGNLDLATNGSAFLRAFGADTVNGAITLGPTGMLDLRDGNASLTLGSGGSLAGSGTVTQDFSGATLTNSGTVNANIGGQTLNITNSNFTNTGTTEVQNGAALSVTSANTDSGNILVKTGGTATFSQGLTQTAGLTQADGTLNSPLTLTGGTLAGTGTVVGAVTNTGGTVSAGSSTSPFGTLAVNGSLTQASGGVLDAVFSSTQNSLLAVKGTVTTGGVLDVSYLGSGPYTGSGPFTFLDYTSLATSLTGTGPTQYFSNEMFLADGTGVIDGSNGFTYELLNDAANKGLQLEVLNNGAPVPEASTTISLGVLLLLGGAGVWRAKRRTAAAAD